MREAVIENPSARRVVNTFSGTTNIIDVHTQIDKLISALDMCILSLKKHVGPTSGYAMLVDAQSIGLNFRPNIYTKDGIDILSSIEFISPLETYIKQVITYTGSRVDAIAKDGTTTTMLFMACLLKTLLEKRGELEGIVYTSKQFTDVFTDYITDVENSLKQRMYTVESIAKEVIHIDHDEELTDLGWMHAGGYVAWMQAMASSGGRIDLANAMHEIFNNSPKQTWNRISFYTSVKESGESFNIEVDNFDMRIRTINAGENLMNEAVGTEYRVKDAEILCYANAMSDMDIKTDNILRWLHGYSGKHPLVIITPYVPGALLTTCKELNSKRKNKISIWQYTPAEQVRGLNYPWELLVLSAMAGVKNYGTPLVHPDDEIDECIFSAHEIYWHDTYMDFIGVVENIDNGVLHPFYTKPGMNKFYDEIRTGLEKTLEKYESGDKKDELNYGLLISMLNTLITLHRPTIRLGGTSHEQASNVSVIRDVQGAIMSSLSSGFVINGPLDLFFAMTDINGFNRIAKYGAMIDGDPTDRKILQYISNCCTTAMAEVIRATYGETFYSCFKNDIENLIHNGGDNSSLKWYWNILGCDAPMKEKVMFKDVKGIDLNTFFEKFTDKEWASKNYPVVHPIRVYTEMMKRILEIAPKLALTNEIVISGGVILNDEQKEKLGEK